MHEIVDILLAQKLIEQHVRYNALVLFVCSAGNLTLIPMKMFQFNTLTAQIEANEILWNGLVFVMIFIFIYRYFHKSEQPSTFIHRRWKKKPVQRALWCSKIWKYLLLLSLSTPLYFHVFNSDFYDFFPTLFCWVLVNVCVCVHAHA